MWPHVDGGLMDPTILPSVLEAKAKYGVENVSLRVDFLRGGRVRVRVYRLGGRRRTKVADEHVALAVVVDAKLRRLYQECQYFSGGYDRNPLFGEIVALGRDIIPVLLRDVADEREDSHIHFWVAIDLLQAVVDDGPTIREEDRGRFDFVRATWLAWGRERDLLS